MKVIKKVSVLIISIIVASIGVTGCSSTIETSSKQNGEVNVICWSEYLPEEVMADFEKESGGKINITTYTSADEMLCPMKK